MILSVVSCSPRKQIDEIREEIGDLRRRSANVKREELENVAFRLGWQFRPKKGGEPRYQKPNRYPLFIPNHRKLKKYTTGGIIDALEEDLDREEEERK